MFNQSHQEFVINNNNTNSGDHWEDVVFICSNYVIPLVCFFGILGNTINLTILTRKSMRRSSPYTYLLGLAVTDMTVLSLSLMDFFLSSILRSTNYWSVVFNAFIFYPISNIFSSSSVWITVLLTVERYVSVRYPLKAKELCTKKLAKRTICVVVLLSSLCNVPRFFGYEIKHCGHHRYEKESSTFEASSSFNLMTWFYICSVHFLPYLLLIYLNTGLVLTVLKANKQRSTLRCISRSFKTLSVARVPLLAGNVNNKVVNNFVNNNNPNTSNNRCDVAPTTTTSNKTKQRIAKLLGCKHFNALNAEVLQMKENHHHHHHLPPSIDRLQNSIQQQTSLDSDSGQIIQSQSRANQIESRPDYNCFEVTSLPRSCNSTILFPQTQGKSIKLFPRRCTNVELYIFAPPTHNLSCLSLPADTRQRRIATFCQGVPIHNSASFPQQQHHQRLSRHSNYFSSEQMRMTVTCISIICLFLICIIPSAFSNRPIAKALFGKGLTMIEFTRGKFYNRLRTATNFLVYCNLSLNFVLYCVFNHRFLVTLRRLVDLRLRKISSACRHGSHESRTSLLCLALSRCRSFLYRGDTSSCSVSSRCGVYAGSNCNYHHHHQHCGRHLVLRREEEAMEIQSDSLIIGSRRHGYGFRRNLSVDRGSENFNCRRSAHANGCHSE